MLHAHEVSSSVACQRGRQLCCLPRRLAALLPIKKIGSCVAYPGGWQLYRTQTPFHACNIASRQKPLPDLMHQSGLMPTTRGRDPAPFFHPVVALLPVILHNIFVLCFLVKRIYVFMTSFYFFYIMLHISILCCINLSYAFVIRVCNNKRAVWVLHRRVFKNVLTLLQITRCSGFSVSYLSSACPRVQQCFHSINSKNKISCRRIQNPILKGLGHEI